MKPTARPITFFPWEVERLISGKLRQFVRPVLPQSSADRPADGYPRCKFGDLDGRLWVREAWRSWRRTCENSDDHEHDDEPCTPHCDQTYVAYAATPRTGYRPKPDRAQITFLDESTPLDSNRELLGPWRPANHMQRWASRFTLRITEIDFQRVEDMPERSILLEGIDVPLVSKVTGVPWGSMPDLYTARAQLWDHHFGVRRVPNPSGAVRHQARTREDESLAWRYNPYAWIIGVEKVVDSDG